MGGSSFWGATPLECNTRRTSLLSLGGRGVPFDSDYSGGDDVTFFFSEGEYSHGHDCHSVSLSSGIGRMLANLFYFVVACSSFRDPRLYMISVLMLYLVPARTLSPECKSG